MDMDDALISEINRMREQQDYDALRQAEEVYVCCSKATGPNIPAIDEDGFANVRTSRESRHQTEEGVVIQRLSREEFQACVKDWYRLGVVKFRVDDGTEKPCREINRDDFLPDGKARMWDYVGSRLNYWIVRYRQHDAGSAESRSMWNAVCQELPKTLMIAPLGRDAAPEGTVCISKGAEQAVQAGKALFYGADDWRDCCSGQGNGAEKGVLVQTEGDGGCYVPVFTDFVTLKRRYGAGTPVAIYTYDEVRKLADTRKAGLLVNPGDLHLLLKPSDLEQVEQERSGGRRLYVDLTPPPKAKPAPAAEPEAEEPAAPVEDIPVPEKAPVQEAPEAELPDYDETEEEAEGKRPWNGLCVASPIAWAAGLALTALCGLLDRSGMTLGYLMISVNAASATLGFAGLFQAVRQKQRGLALGAAGLILAVLQAAFYLA